MILRTENEAGDFPLVVEDRALDDRFLFEREDQFDGLPSDVKDYVYRRLHDVLSGADQSAPFSGLAASERKVIGEILADTKPDFVAAAGR